jgi:membrane protein implicated in regulation of membrane protease activity
MGVLYLAALIVGLGVLGLQFVMGASGGGAEASDLDHADGDHADGDHHGGHGHADAGIVAVFLSIRFWTFGLLAFGLVGSALHFLALASPLGTGILAALMGLGSGALSSLTFRFLSRTQVSSGAEATDAIGQVGRVLIPIERGKRGKIRIALRGQTVDLLASTDDEKLKDGDLVVVEELRGTTAHVSRASREFLPE